MQGGRSGGVLEVLEGGYDVCVGVGGSGGVLEVLEGNMGACGGLWG